MLLIILVLLTIRSLKFASHCCYCCSCSATWAPTLANKTIFLLIFLPTSIAYLPSPHYTLPRLQAAFEANFSNKYSAQHNPVIHSICCFIKLTISNWICVYQQLCYTQTHATLLTTNHALAAVRVVVRHTMCCLFHGKLKTAAILCWFPSG